MQNMSLRELQRRLKDENRLIQRRLNTAVMHAACASYSLRHHVLKITKTGDAMTGFILTAKK